MAVEVPEEGMADGAGFGVFFGAPDRPEVGIVAGDAAVVWEKRLEQGQDLNRRYEKVVTGCENFRTGPSVAGGAVGDGRGRVQKG